MERKKVFKKLTIFAVAAFMCLSAVSLIASSDEAPWMPENCKWIQQPDPNGWDINCCDYILADDFNCIEIGWIQDIHFWGSWYDDMVGTIESFHLSIHSDIPAGVDAPYSHPGDLLWEKDIYDFTIIPMEPSLQGWIKPPSQVWLDNHYQYFRYDIFLDEEDWFLQVGTIEEPVVYWLDIQANVVESNRWWGWKTSINHYIDDAVYLSDPPSFWEPLIDPETGTTIDMAFAITGVPCEPSIDVEKYVLDPDTGEWVQPTQANPLDLPHCTMAEFKISIHNDGTCCDLTNIFVYDFMQDSLEFLSADPPPDTIDPTAIGTDIIWTFPGPLSPCEWINITIYAHVVGEPCSVDENYVYVEALCENSGWVFDSSSVFIHVIEPIEIVKEHPEHGYFPAGEEKQKTLYAITDNTWTNPILDAFNVIGNTISPLVTHPLTPGIWNGPVGMALDDKHDLLFITYEFQSSIYVFDATNFNQLYTVPVPPPSSDLAGIVVDTAADRLYVVERYMNTIYIYDTSVAPMPINYLGTGSITTNGAYGLAFDRVTNRLYVTDGTSTVYEYNPVGWGQTNTYNMGGPAVGIAIDDSHSPASTDILTTGCFWSFDVRKYNIPSGSVSVLTLGDEPAGITVDPVTDLAYVTVSGWNSGIPCVQVIDTTSMTVTDTDNLPYGQVPTDLFIGEVTFDAGYLKPCSKITLSGAPVILWRYYYDGTKYPDAATGDHFYNGEWWYIYNDMTDIHFDEECVHILYYVGIDDAGNYGRIYRQLYYVDGTPPELYKEHPDHGYYPIEPPYIGYLKCCAQITITADDLPSIPGSPCNAGVENIFWRYEFEGTSYPTPFEAGAIDGATLEALYGYTDPDIINYRWYVEDDYVEIHFEEECVHDLYYWAKDNVCNRGPIHHQTYLVDNTPPTITKTHPDPCYFPINQTAGKIKVGDRIILEAEDLPDPPCQSGVENIFWRYEFEGTSYPTSGGIDGATLGALYGYTDPDIINYRWYVEDDYVEISFDEICKHTLYYWAKDNVCNRGPIHEQIYWVNDCHPAVWIDDDFGFYTPGWWHTHFAQKQNALEWLAPGGTAYVYDGTYDEDIVIDDVPCCDNTGITQMGEYGCFPIDEAAVIHGTETIKVNDVTIKYLEYKPTPDGAIIVEDGVTGTTLLCNKFRQDCIVDAVGVKALGSSQVDAELNWWGQPNGPNGGIMDDGAIADGYGVQVIGQVFVEPWIGIHAEIGIPVGTIEVEVGTAVVFDAEGSWAYTYGECCQEPEELPMQYLWDFDDGTSSSHKDTAHVFDTTGTYDVCLRIEAPGIPGLYSNFMYDWDYVKVHVTEPETPLTANADGENLGGYETIIGESVQLYGDAFGGTSPYTWHWDFGDGISTSEQNPTHVYKEEGTYTVTLTVYDSEYTTDTDTSEVTVHGIEELIASINGPSNGVTGMDILFKSSVIGGKQPYIYNWDFDDGTISEEANPLHVYENLGIYTITLTVTDDKGKTDTATTTVNIEEGTTIELAEIIEVKGGFGVKATIKAGDLPVAWSIQVDGGFVLFGGQADGTFEAHMEQTVTLPFTLAFGKVDITVTANQQQQSYTAFALGPFFLNFQEAIA